MRISLKVHLVLTMLTVKVLAVLNKELRAAGTHCVVGQRCHPGPIYLTGSQ